jgi:DNA-binding helix-hairpin-helix protein with protein kinase domain
LFHYGYLMRAARNLAVTVRCLHDWGYVIGDLSAANLLVSPRALVTLVDTDSCQVPAADRVFRCAVGTPEYTPPELQGARFADVDRDPAHDAFGLAVLIFQLLMQGTHPFAGVFTGHGEPASVPARIAAGHWPYARERAIPYRPSPHAPPWETLPPVVQEMFQLCFEVGHADRLRRPNALAWQRALRAAEQQLTTCPANPQHFYEQALAHCPWCAIALQQGRDSFPPS